MIKGGLYNVINLAAFRPTSSGYKLGDPTSSGINIGNPAAGNRLTSCIYETPASWQ